MFLIGFFWGAVIGSLVTQLIIYVAVRRHRTKVGTLSASHNSAMDAILKEADILRKDHPSKDCRFFAESVFRELSKQHHCANVVHHCAGERDCIWYWNNMQVK